MGVTVSQFIPNLFANPILLSSCKWRADGWGFCGQILLTLLLTSGFTTCSSCSWRISCWFFPASQRGRWSWWENHMQVYSSWVTSFWHQMKILNLHCYSRISQRHYFLPRSHLYTWRSWRLATVQWVVLRVTRRLRWFVDWYWRLNILRGYINFQVAVIETYPELIDFDESVLNYFRTQYVTIGAYRDLICWWPVYQSASL